MLSFYKNKSIAWLLHTQEITTFKWLFLVVPSQSEAGGWHIGPCVTTSLYSDSGGAEVRSVEPLSSGRFKWKREFKWDAAGRSPSQERPSPVGLSHKLTTKLSTDWRTDTHRQTHQRCPNLLPPVSCCIVSSFCLFFSPDALQQQHCASGDAF